MTNVNLTTDYSYVVMIHELVRPLGTFSVNYSNKAILSKGKSLPVSTHNPFFNLMHKKCGLLKSGSLRHSIYSFANPPVSYYYSKRSIKGIPAAPIN